MSTARAVAPTPDAPANRATPDPIRAKVKKAILDERIRQEAHDQVRKERAAAEAAGRPKAALVFDGEEALAPTEYLVEGLIPTEGAGELFGETDLGKTTVALDISVHVGANKPWMGHAVRHGAVLFIEAEGGGAFALRKRCSAA
ncbi:MAG TPA: AAA family ATPase [Anaeromyxobacteraceae bacterium]|nr:AAA family ATPase [Anaeromyxobacteraceae bacterium]